MLRCPIWVVRVHAVITADLHGRQQQQALAGYVLQACRLSTAACITWSPIQARAVRASHNLESTVAVETVFQTRLQHRCARALLLLLP
jgi:hypothetical protein